MKLAASFVLGMVCLVLSICGQQYSIDWFTLDGGGGTSTGGVYSVTATIGQADATPQPMTGGSYSLAGGFWSLFALQTAGAPLLTISFTSTNTLAVSWPSPSTGFILQQNTIDLSSDSWSNVSSGIFVDGTNKTFIVNPPTGSRFYRLFKL